MPAAADFGRYTKNLSKDTDTLIALIKVTDGLISVARDRNLVPLVGAGVSIERKPFCRL